MGSKTDKFLAQSILDQIAADRKNKKLQNKTQRIIGQIFRIPIALYKKSFQPVLTDITTTQVDIVTNAYFKRVKDQLEAPFLLSLDKEDKDFYLNLLKKYKQSSPGMKVFVIRKFRDLNEGYGPFAGGRKKVLAAILKQHYRETTEDEDKRLSGSKNKGGTQLGHSDSGTGEAISTVSVQRAKAKVAKAESLRIGEIVEKYESNFDVKVDHTMVVDSDGNFQKDYTPVITVQDSSYNQEQGRQIEKAAYTAFQKDLKDVILDPGSISLPEAITQVTLFNLSGKPNNKKTVKGIKKKAVKERSTGTKKAKNKYSRKTKVITESAADLRQVSAPGKQRVSPFSYMAMINKKLPQTVRKNMSPPGFQNQSGRFANSVKIQDVNITKQGHPSFGYTYAKNPYQVFEVGEGAAPWATPQRDPRKLIDKSIRQVAAELAIGRFYTRRL
jgi:hypothetical protein